MIIYDNMKVGAAMVDVSAVKQAFESTYASLGIICDDVGGMWQASEGKYYEGMEACSGYERVSGYCDVGGRNFDYVSRFTTPPLRAHYGEVWKPCALIPPRRVRT